LRPFGIYFSPNLLEYIFFESTSIEGDGAIVAKALEHTTSASGDYSGHDEWLQKQLMRAVKNLQARPAERRSPFAVSDEELRSIGRELKKKG
jgi:hypothetical protein